jgi:acetyltransferase-like isoleucine patch superfamily enzyme
LSKLILLGTGRQYDVRVRDLRYIFDKGAACFLRGMFWSWLRLRRSRGLLLGRNVKFICASQLRMGRSVYIGHNSYMECAAEGGVTLGDRTTIREFGWLQCRSGLGDRGGTVVIGNSVYIGPFAVLGAGGDVRIGDGCQIGARFTISAEAHENDGGSYVTGAVSRRGITIGPGCWIGNNVCVLDGVTIGANAVIGAGAVVTRDIPAGSVAFGVPARVRNAGGAAGP